MSAAFTATKAVGVRSKFHGIGVREKRKDKKGVNTSVNGMSSCLYVIPMVPFWPCRLANLSPV